LRRERERNGENVKGDGKEREEMKGRDYMQDLHVL